MFNRGISPYGAYGLGGAVKQGINWSSLLTNTQKTLGIINQAIPAFYQVKPIFNNMKTMFRLVNEINKDDKKTDSTIQEANYTSTNTSTNVTEKATTKVNQEQYYSDNSSYNDGPNFFL